MQEALSTITANDKVSMPYPNVTIENLTDALTVVIGILEQGDLPLVANYQGRVYCVANINSSPLNLYKLLQVTPFKYYADGNTCMSIETTEDLFEIRGT